MSEKAKQIHNAYCDLIIANKKAPLPLPLRRNRVTITQKQKSKSTEIKTHNMSKAMLARQLASLF